MTGVRSSEAPDGAANVRRRQPARGRKSPPGNFDQFFAVIRPAAVQRLRYCQWESPHIQGQGRWVGAAPVLNSHHKGSNVAFPPFQVRCTFTSGHVIVWIVWQKLTQPGHSASMDSAVSGPYNLARRLLWKYTFHGRKTHPTSSRRYSGGRCGRLFPPHTRGRGWHAGAAQGSAQRGFVCPYCSSPRTS